MKKGRDYQRLRDCGLPVPIYGVFDERSLSESDESRRLSDLIRRILADGSGQIGVRTEPRQEVSLLGGYPHMMPLATEQAVRKAMEQVLQDHPDQSWWFLVNEAFTQYDWNAIVMLTDRLLLPGGARLEGEVNDLDNVPLREALAKTENCLPIKKWQHPDKRWLRSTIMQSGILNEWLEVSSALANGEKRRVFWGMR